MGAINHREANRNLSKARSALFGCVIINPLQFHKKKPAKLAGLRLPFGATYQFLA
jgi:hypothetical protein